MGLFKEIFQGVLAHVAPCRSLSTLLLALAPLLCLAGMDNISDIEETTEPAIYTEPLTSSSIEIDIDSLLDDLTSEYIEQKNIVATESAENSDKQKLLSALVATDKANLIILNKITTKSQDIVFDLGEKQFFGNLSIEVHKCVKSTDPFKANDLMLLSVKHIQIDDDSKLIFHGWVASSAPALSTLEHPIYEIIPKQCIIATPTE